MLAAGMLKAPRDVCALDGRVAANMMAAVAKRMTTNLSIVCLPVIADDRPWHYGLPVEREPVNFQRDR